MNLWPIPNWLLIDVTVAIAGLVVINSVVSWCLAHDPFHRLFRSLCLFGLVSHFIYPGHN